MNGFVLAGGRSSRMGCDKALLQCDGKTLLERALATVGSVAQNAAIVGDADKYSQFGRVVEDIYRNCGPLGGIHAALTASETDYNLMLAVDMPFIPHELLEFLIVRARSSRSIVTAPEADGRLQPLCAVYHQQFLTVAEQALTRRENKITSLFETLDTHIISSTELRSAGFAVDVFRNWNTLADLEPEIATGKTERR